MREYIDEHRDGIIDELSQLVRIPSVRGNECDGAPFGQDCVTCLEAAKSLYAKHGIDVKISHDRKYGLAALGNGERKIGLFAHLDVVPPDGDWIYTSNPFEPRLVDNCLVGRGAEDNKSGVILSLYAVKLLRDLGVDTKCRLEIFLGTNEESGMEDIESYKQNNSLPDVAIIPDGGFPVSIGERSICRFFAVNDSEFSDILSMEGGSAFNIVLGELCVRMKYSDSLFAEATEICRNDDRLSVSQNADEISVLAHGLSKHAGNPEGGINAAYVFANAFKDCASLCEADRHILEEAALLTGSFFGEGFGIENDDSLFGRLTCVNGICKTENRRLSLSFDVRFGVSLDRAEALEKIRMSAERHGFGIADVSGSDGFGIGRENIFAQSLESVYNECEQLSTGRECGGKAFYCSGGTYARKLGGNSFSVGTQAGYIGECIAMPQGHGGAHQPDEQLSVERFLEAIKIVAMMIVRCDEILAEGDA